MPDVTIFVCTTCRTADDTAEVRLPVAWLAMDDAPGIAVRGVECLANCKRGPAVAMTRHGGWTYIFGGLDPAVDGAAVLEGARLLGCSEDGLMPWRGRPDALKRGMTARVPPLPELAA